VATWTVAADAATADGLATALFVSDPAVSRGYQERFAAAVPAVVIGKSLDDVEVGKLADASGCPDGFNDALAKIREQARTGN
jgi:thiamine biosynthesis lipoprotein ApbE